jgi:hypothetical protein
MSSVRGKTREEDLKKPKPQKKKEKRSGRRKNLADSKDNSSDRRV